MKSRIFICMVLVPALLVGCGDLYPKIMGTGTNNNTSEMYGKNNSEQYGTSTSNQYGASNDSLYGKKSGDDYTQYANADDYSDSRVKKIETEKPVSATQKTTVAAAAVVDEPVQNYGTINPNDVKPIYKPVEADDVLLVPKKIASEAPKVTVVKPESGEITVQRGDTLFSISQKYDVPLRDLLDVNKLTPPYSITVGQKLKLPNSLYHTVNPGETLYSISRAYSVDLNSLVRENNLTQPYGLYQGQKLRLPGRVVTPQLPTPPVVTEPVLATTKTTTTAAAVTKTPVATSSMYGAPSVPTTKTPATTPGVTTTPKISSTTSTGRVIKLPETAARTSTKFSWPVQGKIISDFGAKNNGLYNDGINISAAEGTTVKASENGVVAYAGNELKGMGNLVIVQHSGGWMTVYAHMKEMSVKRGARVALGQKIGTVGKTGKVSSPQLHFEIRKGTKAYNPTTQMKK